MCIYFQNLIQYNPINVLYIYSQTTKLVQKKKFFKQRIILVTKKTSFFKILFQTNNLFCLYLGQNIYISKYVRINSLSSVIFV